MARIAYIEEKEHPELTEPVARIKGLRGGLINIYKLLLHSPAIASGWFDLINATRKTKLSGRMRELAIVRIASSFNYAYALNQHVGRIATAEGVSPAECAALKDWRVSKSFSESERAVLAGVDAMLNGPEVADDVFDAVRKHLSEQEILELSVIVGAYMMHNRVFTALRVDLEPKKD